MLKIGPKSFVMHWIGNDRLHKLLTEEPKKMHLGHLGLFHLLLHHTNPHTGRIHVTAKHLSEHWGLPPSRTRSYLKHLLRIQVLSRCPDPEDTGKSFLVPHPFMASAGTDVRRETLWREYLAGLGDVDPLLDLPTDAELIPHSARRKFKKRSRLDGPRFAPAPGGRVIATVEP